MQACAPQIPSEILRFQSDLEAVRRLPRVLNNETILSRNSNNLDRICRLDKPSFRRLFTHETWETYLGGNNLARWARCIRGISTSVIVLATWQSVALVFGYALTITLLLPKAVLEATAQHQLSLTICGSAIGLLLVFRTNAAYERLNEARRLWGRVASLVREIASRVATSEAEPGSDDGLSSGAVVEVCRLLLAFCWALRDELRDGDRREDILKLLVPDVEEEHWLAACPSRALAIHSRIRARLQRAWGRGEMPEHIAFMLESDLGALAAVHADCNRLFTSPIPPTMSRHGLRSLLLWLLALPVALAGSGPAWLTATWTATTAFVYLGIDELGVQVEQPFQILPLWQVCLAAQDEVEVALSSAHRPLPLCRSASQ